MKKFGLFAVAFSILAVSLYILSIGHTATGQANIPCYRMQGGVKNVAGSGCEYEFQSGSTLDVQSGATFSAEDLTVSDDLSVTDDLVVTGKMNLQPNEQNIGVMSVMTASVTYLSSGAIFTVTAGELWVVHEVLLNVLTNFNCTGDDCTLIVGDSNDTDGFLVLADAALQAADTEFTGAEAGWQGMAAATQGVYLDEVTTAASHWYVYDGAETIDIAVGGTSPAAGTAVVYLFYTRIH